jgi:uncharacterized protein
MSIESDLKFGLTESTISRISSVFAAVPEIEQVILYGSRAMGTFRKGSDIDLTIKGNQVTYAQLQRIENQLDDLLLPYTIDISLLQQIDNPDLLEHIKRVGVLFYEKKVV